LARQEKSVEKHSKISENDEREEERRNGEAALASKNYPVVRSQMRWMDDWMIVG
jgi:hypothetical protein